MESRTKGWNIWTLISHISKETEELEWEEIEKIYEPWVINRAFQADLIILDSLVVDLNRYASKLPKEVQYKILQRSISKQKRYLPYLKDAKNVDVVKKLANWFSIREEEMQMYMKFLSKERINYFLEMINKHEKFASGKQTIEKKKSTRRKK